MRLFGILGAAAMLFVLCGGVQAADVILNEYNAVAGTEFLGGGNSAADEAGGRASDSYFGRVPGNGGDWFELVVITDHLDMRGWHLDILENGALDEILDLTDHEIWSDLRAGTIITVAEDVPSDISYDPNANDWWINVQARDDADGLYIEASSFPVSNSDWQLRIRNSAGGIVFGPAGEGISPTSGVSTTEVFRLEDDPDPNVTPNSNDYDDASDSSTFGAPNRWGVQDILELRTVAPAPATISLLSPTALDTFTAGDVVTILWESDGVNEPVQVEFSLDGGYGWSEVYPPNVGNSGQYEWLVPLVVSDHCLIRVSSTTRPGVYDVSDGPFIIFACGLDADLTGDCLVNFFDFAIVASVWLQ